MILSPLLSQIPHLLHAFGTLGDIETPKNLVVSKQVHGTKIFFAKDMANNLDGFDALMTDQKNVAVAVRTADCLPLLMVDPTKGLIAAVHAGWKGTFQRIAEKAVKKFISLGSQPVDIIAALGPCMKGECYEVEEDVALSFEEEFPGRAILKKKSKTKWLLNITETNRLQLIAAGLSPEKIDQVDLCTYCRPDLFYSFRREGEKAGRMVSFIQWVDKKFSAVDLNKEARQEGY